MKRFEIRTIYIDTPNGVARVVVELTIDVDALAKKLGRKAFKNKTRRTGLLQNSLVARVNVGV